MRVYAHIQILDARQGQGQSHDFWFVVFELVNESKTQI